MKLEARDSSGFGLGTGERRPTGLRKTWVTIRMGSTRSLSFNSSHVKTALECIKKQMASEVDVAALFLDLQNLHHVGPWARQAGDGPKFRGMHQAREFLRAQKHTHVDGNFRNGGEGIKIDLLPSWAVRI
jgi:hypothetical protein